MACRSTHPHPHHETAVCLERLGRQKTVAENALEDSPTLKKIQQVLGFLPERDLIDSVHAAGGRRRFSALVRTILGVPAAFATLSAMASRWKGTLGQRKPGPIVEAWHGKVKPPPLRRRAGRPNPPARLKDGLRLVLDREQRPMAALVACRTLVAPLPLPELCAGNGGVLRRIATSTPVPSRRQRNRLRRSSPPAVFLSSFGTTPCVTWEPDRCL